MQKDKPLKNIRMTNSEFKTATEVGLLEFNTIGLDSDTALLAIKAKHGLKDYSAKYDALYADLNIEVGIEDGAKFDERIKELREIEKPTKEQQKELDSMNEKWTKLMGLRRAFMKSDIKIDFEPMDYTTWRKIVDANTDNGKSVFGIYNLIQDDKVVAHINIEDALENVLWKV